MGMRRILLLWGALVLIFPAASLRLTPLPEVQSRPAAAGTLDRDGLVELSLVLSGVPSQAMPAYRRVLDRWTAEFQTKIDPGWDEARKAEELLLSLHSHLRGYSLYQTRLDVLIDQGTFNCVSSALAYMILGRAVGLDVQAVATPDHAFALVRLASGRSVDVETTTKYGFNPGTKTEFTNAFGKTGFAYVPPGNYSQRRNIGDRQLLGLLVQNQMANDQIAGQPEAAVGPAIDRWIFEGTPEAFKTLIDGFVNDAAQLNASQDYLKGLDLVDKMLGWTGPVAEAKQLAWAFLNNQVNILVDRQDFAGAETLTTSWNNRGLLTEGQSGQIFGLIVDSRLTSNMKTLPPAQVASEIEQAFAQGWMTDARRSELLSFAYGQQVQRVASEKGPQAAWSYIKSLPAPIQTLPTLVKAAQIYEYNWGVEVHNRFAQSWNAGKKDQARQILKDALEISPNNALLKRDWSQSQGN